MRFCVCFFLLFILLLPCLPARAQDEATPSAPPTSGLSPATPPPESPLPVPLKGEVKIEPEFLQDMQKFYGQCAGNSVTATYYDCRCLAVKYIDKRIERGRYYEPQELMNEIRGECSNPTEIAGYSYGVCKSQLALMDRAENSEAYCECFANAFAKAYQKNPDLSSRYIQVLQRNAYVKCDEHRRD